jgi:hypothetical protein
MKMCVMLLIGSVLTGSSLVVALAWKEDPEPSAALARPFAVLSVTDWLYRAPGPGGGYLLQAQTARGGPAPQLTNGVPRALAFSLSPLNSRAWPLTNSGSNSNIWIYVPQRGSSAPGSPDAAEPAAPPGVYESEPYKAIVVVPDPHWDDRCLAFGGRPTAPMPVHKPKLRLIPRGN